MKDQKYTAWKSSKNADPIEGTDRVFSAISARKVLSLLASEEGVKYYPHMKIIRCSDGTFWSVSLLNY